MKKVILSTVLALLLMLCATPAYAGIPTLPHAFYGDVWINDEPALDGTNVSAVVDVGDIVPVQNPVGTTAGKYGVNSPHLLVQGNIKNGAVITFYVDGIAVEGVAVTFEIGGGATKQDLSVVKEEPEPEPEPSPTPSGNGIGASGGADGAVIYGIDTDLFGTESTFFTGYDGGIAKTVEATSEDGNLAVTLPKGTIALNKKGKPLKAMGVTVDKDPPSPPKDASVIGLTYDFTPAGATFEPPITFTWSYDPATLPEDVAEENLGLAYHDGVKWVELECVVDTETNIITALVSHFTTFAVIGFTTPAPIPAPVITPEPIPEAPTITPEPEPTIVPPVVISPEPEPKPEPTKPPAPLLPPEPKPSPVNWLVVALFGLAGIVIVVWIVRRRRAEQGGRAGGLSD